MLRPRWRPPHRLDRPAGAAGEARVRFDRISGNRGIDPPTVTTPAACALSFVAAAFKIARRRNCRCGTGSLRGGRGLFEITNGVATRDADLAGQVRVVGAPSTPPGRLKARAKISSARPTMLRGMKMMKR